MGNTKSSSSSLNTPLGLLKYLRDSLKKGLPEKEYLGVERDEIAADPDGTKRRALVTEGLKPKNVPKNRYINILPNDETRVKLQPLSTNETLSEEDLDSQTYINANRLTLDKLTYIAAQAPVPATIKDFWLMIWQQDIPVVVMLTKENEGGQPKSSKYWPEEVQEKTYGYEPVGTAFETWGGSIKVTMTGIAEFDADIVARYFSLQTLEGSETKEVVQYQYIAWPDHGVPEEQNSILKLMELVDSDMSKYQSNPILVHCSAGIGRTGAFILIHSALNFIKQGKEFQLKEMLRDIRKQRNGMVNSPAQFTFVYSSLLKHIQNTAVKASPRRPTT